MKITIESTTKVITLSTGGATVFARIWEGQTDTGIPVHCYVTRIAVSRDADCSQFERELQECQEPSAEIAAIPLRLVL